jgi:hypothetical protein
MPLAEFAYYNCLTSAQGMTPFYANYGCHPSAGAAPTETNTLSVSSIAYEHWMLAVFEDCKKEVGKSSERMKKYADQHRLEPPFSEPCDLVMLNGKNIKTHRPDRKLKHKIYGPYEILDIISPTAIRFRLPKTSKIHPVFHVSLRQRTK